MTQTVRAHIVPVQVPPMLEKVSRLNRLGCNAGCQKISRCHTKGDCEEFFACRQRRMQMRDPAWLWKPGLMPPEVQNRGTRVCPPKFFFEKLKIINYFYKTYWLCKCMWYINDLRKNMNFDLLLSENMKIDKPSPPQDDWWLCCKLPEDCFLLFQRRRRVSWEISLRTMCLRFY